jgi:alpha-ketoglutarate-dependent taurine dioxygenase
MTSTYALDRVEPALHPAGLPLIVTPTDAVLASDPEAAREWFAAELPGIEGVLSTVGAILFRGFAVSASEDFARLVSPIPVVDFDYAGGGTPRGTVVGKVYEATQLPPVQRLPLHQEMSYLPHYPTKLAFYCATPAETGGETILGDIRRIAKDLPPEIVERVRRAGILYSRNFRHPDSTFGNERLDHRHKTWVQGFMTEDPAEVNRSAAQMGLDVEWLKDGSVTTHFRAPGFAHHPVTGEEVWFNLTGVASYDGDEELQRLIREHYAPDAPHYADTTLGDGSPFSDTDREAISAAYNKNVVEEGWQRGDVLLVDNMYVCHGRNPYTGKRDTQVILLGPGGKQ